MPDMNSVNTRDYFAPESHVGLTPRDVGKFDFAELIRAAATEDSSRLGLYRDINRAYEAKGFMPATGGSFFIPPEKLQRDLTAGSASGGGYLVSQELSFASGLFGSSLYTALPIRRLAATGNATIVIPTSVGAATWLSTEATPTGNTDPVFGQRSATPKLISATAFLSSMMVAEAGDSPKFMQQQLGAKLAEGISTAMISGAGTLGQPLGLLNLSGTTSVSGTSLAYSSLCTLLAAIEGYQSKDIVFVLGVTAARILRQREVAAGSGAVLVDGRIAGYPAIVSRCVTDDALVVTTWSNITMCTWGPLQMTITPLGSPTAFKLGQVGVRVSWAVEFLPDAPAVIGKATSIT